LEWFETLYQTAEADPSRIPWADLKVNPNLTDWLARGRITGNGRRALVVGCGLGDDAEVLQTLGFQVTAFDISKTCMDWCRKRYPSSSVDYLTADLLSPRDTWRQAFDFVLEIYTLQVLPDSLRAAAIHRLAEFVAPGGTLMVIARGREPADDPGQMPWPLTRVELDEFNQAGLMTVQFEDFLDAEQPPVRRFRVEYSRSR
jgi:SAM-dependent methyltransferase